MLLFPFSRNRNILFLSFFIKDRSFDRLWPLFSYMDSIHYLYVFLPIYNRMAIIQGLGNYFHDIRQFSDLFSPNPTDSHYFPPKYFLLGNIIYIYLSDYKNTQSNITPVSLHSRWCCAPSTRHSDNDTLLCQPVFLDWFSSVCLLCRCTGCCPDMVGLLLVNWATTRADASSQRAAFQDCLATGNRKETTN